MEGSFGLEKGGGSPGGILDLWTSLSPLAYL